MANFTVGDDITRPAGADLTAKSFYIVKLASGVLQLATAGTDKILGVISKAPIASATGSATSVHARNARGTFKVILSGTCNENDALTATTGGKAIVTTTSGDQVLGYACEQGVDGQLVEYMPTTGKY